MLSHSYACLLAPEGARAFALRHGFTEVDNSTLVSPESLSEYQKWSVNRAKPAANEMSQGGGEVGTVGAVVRDRDGSLAAATSTGGNQKHSIILFKEVVAVTFIRVSECRYEIQQWVTLHVPLTTIQLHSVS